MDPIISLFAVCLFSKVVVGQACDESNPTYNFVNQCATNANPNNEIYLGDPISICSSYYCCINQKLTLNNCDIGKVFQNGECTTTTAPSCQSDCSDKRYQKFLLACTLGKKYEYNTFDNCRSIFMCDNSMKLSLIDCSNSTGEITATAMCISPTNPCILQSG